MIKCISLPCLPSIHCSSSRSCLGAHQHAINGSAWPKRFLSALRFESHDLRTSSLDESLEGRVNLGTSYRVTAFESQCSSKHLGHAETLIACWCAPRQEREDKQ